MCVRGASRSKRAIPARLADDDRLRPGVRRGINHRQKSDSRKIRPRGSETDSQKDKLPPLAFIEGATGEGNIRDQLGFGTRTPRKISLRGSFRSHWCRRGPAQPHSPSPELSTAMNAFWLISTLPIAFIRFFPSFCFCSNFRFRVMSPP